MNAYTEIGYVSIGVNEPDHSVDVAGRLASNPVCSRKISYPTTFRARGYVPYVMTFQEIATEMGLTMNEVRGAYYSGIGKLRRNPQAARELAQLIDESHKAVYGVN